MDVKNEDKLNDLFESNNSNESDIDAIEYIFNAIIIFIDLSKSTEIKKQHPFPQWLEIINFFYKIATKEFKDNFISPIKFIGDAVLYCIPFPKNDVDKDKIQKYYEYRKKMHSGVLDYEKAVEELKCTPDGILEICIRTKNSWWKKHQPYLDNDDTKDGFRTLTIAIDYGPIYDFNTFVGVSELIAQENHQHYFVTPDPLGIPVDRCSRISNVAGPNQILMSEHFYNMLEKEDNKNKIDHVSINKDFLKGINDEKHIYFVKPEGEELNWVLSQEARTLIEDEKHMVHKVKMKLLRSINAELVKKLYEKESVGERNENE